MSDFRKAPSRERLETLLETLEPGSRLEHISMFPQSFSNATHLVNARTKTGTLLQVVLRRYNPTNESPARKTVREFNALKVLQDSGVPAPQPLLMDEAGELLGSPSIVTSFVEGKQFLGLADPTAWAKALAEMLVNIHNVSCDLSADYWMDGNTEALWFIRSESLTEQMTPHEDGELVWQTVRDHVAHLTPVPSRFSHIDFWSGNILWRNAKISAVLDWEEAARCDPAYDLAYARMELSLLGLEDTARVLLETYQAETGKPVENLAFWELAASVRSMPDPAGWIPEWVALGHPGFDDTTVRKRLRGFIARARQNIGV
jgi:aminoglycoside phosphotransferase (APT) family kinase protein